MKSRMTYEQYNSYKKEVIANEKQYFGSTRVFSK